jgi:hypothetical protein
MQSDSIRAPAGRGGQRLPEWRRASGCNDVKSNGVAEWLHVSVRIDETNASGTNFLSLTAMRHCVFNHQSPVAPYAAYAKVKAQRCSEICKLGLPVFSSTLSKSTTYTQDYSRRDVHRPSHVQHSTGPPKLPHARCVPSRTMVQHWCASWRAQHRRVLPVLVRANKLRREELGVDGDAYASLLGTSAIPVLWGARSES